MHVYFTTLQNNQKVCFCFWHIMTLVLKAKALENVVGTDSFGLGFGICGLTASAL